MGYGVNQKGYRCYDPKTRRVITTMNCNFLETEFFYHLGTQGESERQGKTQETDSLRWYVPSHFDVGPTEQVGTIHEPTSSTETNPTMLPPRSDDPAVTESEVIHDSPLENSVISDPLIQRKRILRLIKILGNMCAP